jgi:hypothetical protein
MAAIERARAELQRVEDPREAAVFVARTEALRYLAEKAYAGHEVQNQAAELALRAKRRAGELLAASALSRGGRPSETGDTVSMVSPPTLDELGIQPKDSQRWQAVASVPEDRFEQHLAEQQTAGRELTTAGVLAVAKHLSAQTARKAELNGRLIEPIDDYAEGPGWRLFGGEFQERLAGLPDGCIDAFVTDPPYPAESLPLWGELAKHAARLLKPQGLLIALTGQILLPQVIEHVSEYLSYGWVYVQPLPGQNSRIMERHVFQTWKPWLAFSNGTWPSGAIRWHEDTTPASVAQKSYRWQQDAGPAAYLIEHLTDEGDVVCDPSAGTGSYGEAVVGLEREFIGCEADAGRFAKAVERLRSRNA